MNMGEIAFRTAVPFPLLGVLVALPLLLSAVLRKMSDSRRVYAVSLTGGAIELGLTVLLLARFQRGTSDLQFVERVPLFGGLAYHVGVDGVSVLFLPLTALLTLLVTLYAQEVAKERPARYLSAIFALEAVLMGAFVSLDLLLFWVFSSLELLPGFWLVRDWGTGSGRVAAARRYAALNMMGVLLLLAGALVIGRSAGAPPFTLTSLLAADVPPKAQALAFWLMMLGFAVRIPIFPFHGWLPKVLEEGPVVGVSVFLVGAKLGAYGILRFVIPVLPEAAHRYSGTIAIFGVVGIVYGGLLALVQTNLRRLVAFACLAHMGSVLVGLSSLNFEGLTGALLVTLNVGLSAAGLYFVAGFLHRRLGSTEVDRPTHYAPILALTFLLVGLSTIGMPGTSGFEAEHLVVVGALGAHRSAMAIAVGAGSLLGAAYLLRYFQRAFLAAAGGALAPTATPMRPRLPDLRVREIIIAGAVAAVIVGLGLFSHPLLDVVGGSLRAMSEEVETPRAPARVGSRNEAR